MTGLAGNFTPWKERNLTARADNRESTTPPDLGWSGVDLGILVAFLAFTLPITLPVFQSFFTFDDLQNLSYYTRRPAQALWSNLVVFTSFRRPAGALFYLPSYWLFGLNPLPLYLAGFLLFYLNLTLYYRLVVVLTGRRLTAVLALLVFAFHPLLANVLFNFGAVYEVLACSSVLLGLLSYRAYRVGGDNRLGWLTLGIYLVGLNAKETAVVLPLLLLLYEVLYVRSPDWKRAVLKLAPFFVVALAYTLIKTLGSEAFWRTNPLYALHFDVTGYLNLAAYHAALLGRAENFGPLELALFLASVLGLGFVLSDRHLLFGYLAFLVTLLPVLFLPRVWALFLYLPLGGAALFAGRLATVLLLGLAGTVAVGKGFQTRRAAHLLTGLALVVALRATLVWSAPQIRSARNVYFLDRTLKWRDFSAQLYRQLDSVSKGEVLGFRNPPFDFTTADRWSLHFLVWLHYDPTNTLQVYQLPEQEQDFQRAAARAPRVHEFEWQDGNLRKISLPDSR